MYVLNFLLQSKIPYSQNCPQEPKWSAAKKILDFEVGEKKKGGSELAKIASTDRK